MLKKIMIRCYTMNKAGTKAYIKIYIQYKQAKKGFA